MKDQIKRWNQLAGTTAKSSRVNKQSRLVEQDLYGNEFMKSLLNEDLADDLAKKKKEGGDSDDSSDDKDAAEKEEEKESEIGDKEDEAETSAAELKASLKNAAGAVADAVPAKTRDEFVGLFNDIKDIASGGEEAKMKQIAKKIAQLK